MKTLKEHTDKGRTSVLSQNKYIWKCSVLFNQELYSVHRSLFSTNNLLAICFYFFLYFSHMRSSELKACLKQDTNATATEPNLLYVVGLFGSHGKGLTKNVVRACSRIDNYQISQYCCQHTMNIAWLHAIFHFFFFIHKLWLFVCKSILCFSCRSRVAERKRNNTNIMSSGPGDIPVRFLTIYSFVFGCFFSIAIFIQLTVCIGKCQHSKISN